MMNLRKIYILIMIIVLFVTIGNPVFAEGWGYQKGSNGNKPDVGRYANMLSGFNAYYVEYTNEKNIYLTFDNGYEQGYTNDILDVLAKHEVPATFFVTGHYVKEEPSLIKRIVSEGHIIGNHSDSHPDFTTLSTGEIKKEIQAVEKAVAHLTTQEEMYYVRPPRGTFNERTIRLLDELGYIQMFWSLAFKDWEIDAQKGWKFAYNQMMEQIHPGAIVLLHAVSADNAEALEHIIIDLKKAGYTFRSLDEFMIRQTIEKDILF